MNAWLFALISVAISQMALLPSDAFTATRPPTTRPRSKTALIYKIQDETDVDPSFLLTQGTLAIPNTPLAQNDFSLPTKDDVTVSLLPNDYQRNNFGKQKPYPLVISPKSDSSLRFLQTFLSTNKDWLDSMMLQYGAILFRDFDIQTAQNVEDALLAYEPNLSVEYRGTSPRSAQDGTTRVFSAADVPSHYPIAQHLEMSFLESLPRKLFFSALQAPEASGGETALSDFQGVFQDISPQLRHKLATKKLLYRRTHHKRGARFTHDVAAMKSWPEVFGTNDKQEVEKIAARENMQGVRWEGKKQDTFVTEYTSEPFQLHPITKKPVWFNHANVFHWTTFPAELFFAFGRTKDIRFLLRALYISIKSVIQYGLLGQHTGVEVTFGDGTPLSLKEASEMRQAVHKNMVLNRWKTGDLVLIDNFRTAHGRQPTFDSGRRIVVAWSDSEQKRNEFVATTTNMISDQS